MSSLRGKNLEMFLQNAKKKEEDKKKAEAGGGEVDRKVAKKGGTAEEVQKEVRAEEEGAQKEVA